MRVRSAVAAVSMVVAAAVASGFAGGVSRAAPSPAQAAPITVAGTLERLVVDAAADAHDVRYAVRGDEQTWWLAGVTDPVPPPGSEIEVVGTAVDDHTLAVERLTVTSVSTADATPQAPASTNVLVMRVFWTASPPAVPDTTTTRERTVTASRAWFGEVSHGRYAVSGAVTPWLRIPAPNTDCFSASFSAMDQALDAAARAGYNLGSYERAILYMPCSAGGILGLGSLPGPYTWVYETLAKNVLMHEQGHNLGLEHAGSRECRGRAWGSLTWSSDCTVVEYGDEIDTMGNRRSGHYGAYYKSQLGWLQQVATVTSSRTVTLAPHATTGSGLKAVRVRSGTATFWLEYRTRTGQDAVLPAGTAGVQIRYQVGARTQLLDAAPGSETGYYDFVDAHLPKGSSWTTPQGVRITVTGQTSSGATVAIRFGAGAPLAPNAPPSATAQARVNGARITWARPADNGAIIRQYVVTRVDNGATRTVTTTGGLKTSYLWEGLSPSRTYRFAVRAVNTAGRSVATTSAAVRPLTDKPSVVITSPAAGATVQGTVSVEIDVARNPYTNQSIRNVTLYVDGDYVAGDSSSPWGPLRWDTRPYANGSHTIRVDVWDAAGKTASTRRSVSLQNPPPTATITSPANGATVFGDVPVTYSLGPAGWAWQVVDLYVDGAWVDSVAPGGQLSFTTVDPGSHSVRVWATDRWDRVVKSAAVSVTVPTPTVTITAPSDGATVSAARDVTYTLGPSDWDWQYVDLYADDQWLDSTSSPGTALRLDPVTVGPGSPRLEVRATDGRGVTVEAGITITVPSPTVAITSPSAGATLSGPFSVSYTLAPSGWRWSQAWLELDGWAVAWAASPGDPIAFDPTGYGDGTHTLAVVGYDEQGRVFSSPARTVTFAGT